MSKTREVPCLWNVPLRVGIEIKGDGLVSIARGEWTDGNASHGVELLVEWDPTIQEWLLKVHDTIKTRFENDVSFTLFLAYRKGGFKLLSKSPESEYDRPKVLARDLNALFYLNKELTDALVKVCSTKLPVYFKRS